MRGLIERLLRGVAMALLLLLLWRHLPRAASPGAGVPTSVLTVADPGRDTSGRATVDALVRAALRSPDAAAPPRAHISLSALPAPASRAALAAAARGGLGLGWTDSTRAAGLAVSAASVPGDDRIVLSASAAPGSVVMRDDGGTLDSLPVSGTGAGLLVRRGGSRFEAVQGRSTARVDVPPPVVRRRILLYGRPGWESKFTIAALEEAGWKTDASLPVSPRASVTVGSPAALDTARYAAAIVIDSGLARASTLSRFILQGGGVILSGDALSDRALTGVVPVRVAGSRTVIPGGLLSPAPTTGLEGFRVTPVANAVVLHREPDRRPAVVVMRRGAGRVLASAYRESWRWRMEGGADAVDAHRAWWTGQVRAVAYAPVASEADTSGAPATARAVRDAAPYATLVDRLGPPSPPPAAPRADAPAGRDRRHDLTFLSIAFAALIAEWASRRLRGAR